MTDMIRDQELKDHKTKDVMTKLLSFEEIYEIKVEMEQQEKIKQSAYDGKSNAPQDILLSTSNKGLTPRQRK